MGPLDLYTIRRKVWCGYLSPLKNPSSRLGLNQRPLGLVASTFNYYNTAATFCDIAYGVGILTIGSRRLSGLLVVGIALHSGSHRFDFLSEKTD
jgi:hypothetical protein